MTGRARANQRVVRKTCLLVGEGKSEKAFFDHLRSVYEKREGPAVTSKAGNGGSPLSVIKFALSQCQSKAYDRVLILVDTDVVYDVSKSTEAALKKYRAQVLDSDPCLEGLLLAILGEKVPHDSDKCKSKLRPHLTGRITDALSFKKSFPASVLQGKRAAILPLDILIRSIETSHPDSC